MNMSQNNLYFSLPGDFTLQFTSSAAKLNDLSETLLRAYVPGISQLESKPTKVDIIIEHEKVAESYKNYFEYLWKIAKK